MTAASKDIAPPVAWGVLGVAGIAVHKVIPAMQATGTTPVVAIASRTSGKAEQAAADLGIERAYGSYEELLADGDVEAVYIPLPNHLHAEWTAKAAAAGKHVLCEKPLAMSSAQAREMIEACNGAGVKLMEAFMYRHHPMWVEARRLVESGGIGDLLAVQSFFSYRNVDPENIRNVADYGGGALMDVGCYPVNVARMLFGSEPSGVKAAIRRDPEFGTDVLTSAVLDFGGRQATFTCSTQAENEQSVQIVGTNGRIEIEIPFNIPPDRPTRFFHYAGGDPPTDPHVEVHEFPATDQYGIQADLFSRAIRDDLPVPTDPSDAVANLEVMERIVTDSMVP
jgi:predicted dehydrogenase